MTALMFYIAGVDNQSDTQVELVNPAKLSDNVKVPPGRTVPCDPPIFVPNIMFNPSAEICVTTEVGEFCLRQWDDQLLSFLVRQGENVLAPPPGPGPGAVQLVVNATGGIGVLPLRAAEVK